MASQPIDAREYDAGQHSVVIGPHALRSLEHMLGDQAANARLFILGDEHTIQLCLPELLRMIPSLREAGTITVPPGEASKSLDMSTLVWEELIAQEADRSTVLLSLGGGVVTDLGGFVAATFKRGIRSVHVPTTLMGMVDAAIGGKTAIDLGGVKNVVGVYHDPLGVYVHVPFLRTLGKRELLNGLAEMIKHGLTCEAAHFEAIRQGALHDLEVLTPLIERSAAIKCAVVRSDPRETGSRKLLNFGHTIGHGIEAYSWEGDQRALLHGEAVAIGMLCEAWLSWRMDLLDRSGYDEVAALLLDLYRPQVFDSSAPHRIIELMRNDKKNTRGEFRFTLLNAIGSARTDVPISAAQVQEALEHYRLLARERA